MIDLQPFCGKCDIRSYLNAPLSLDNYTYASNGHLLIRVDRRSDTPAPDNLPEKIADTFRALPEQALQKRGTETGTLRLADFEPELTDCNECEGTGLTYVCPECQGDGEVFTQGDFYDYEAECKVCEGSGTISDNQIESLRRRNSRHPGVNKAPNRCQSCAGSGKQPKEDKHTVGDTTLGAAYLLLFKTLPNATVYAFGKNDFALIVFDGGLGILMPRRD
jgi:hypothetical protein